MFLNHLLIRFYRIFIIFNIIVGLQYSSDVANATNIEISWPDIEIIQYQSGFSSPVHVTNAGDSSDRLFVVERSGLIRIIEDGLALSNPFLDIRDRIRSIGSEEGLLSMAFPPDYLSKGYFYVYYTNENGDNQVSRFSISSDKNMANPNSEFLILYLNHPNYTNHNGGQIAFGPDGYLYIATGDGGGGGDPGNNAQNPESLLGKILRIDVEIVPTKIEGTHHSFLPMLAGGSGETWGGPYRIPPDNPFLDMPGYRKEIWALGMRNPWRFSFDRDIGDLYIGDVGQSSWEEINFEFHDDLGGENYGWNEMEGEECYLTKCDEEGKKLPIYQYRTHENGSCAVTGGFVYRGTNYPDLIGIYIFGDYCNGVIYGLQEEGGIWQAKPLLDTESLISSFGEDEAGELYMADLKGGKIFQIVKGSP